MIPSEKRMAVVRALDQAFGVREFEDIQAVTGGHTSSLVFRIVVRGAPFLLKIILRADSPARHYTCMRAAAEAALAPRVWYTSVDDKISITDFVEAKPFPMADALVRMPEVLRRLHALPPFDGVPNSINTSCMFLRNGGPMVDRFTERFRAARVLSEAECAELFERYGQIAAVYAHCEADMVSSHNDLFKPDNILFDGRRVWLVDWEAAFLNDRYPDLAVVANLVVADEAQEQIYLQEYFGAALDAYRRARFFLARQISHIFYAMVYLMIGSGAGTAPEFGDFQRRMWSGGVDLADAGTKTVYGRLHWERLLHGVRQPRFHQAIGIVGGRE